MKIDERGLSEMLHRRAEAINAAPADPPAALRRARRRLTRTGVIGVLAATALAFGAVAGVHALHASNPPVPISRPTPPPLVVGHNGRIAVTTPRGFVESPDHVFSSLNYLFSVALDGTDPQVLARLQTEYPDWSPDGSMVAFDNGMVLQTEGLNLLEWQTEKGHIFTVNADGTGLTQVTEGDGAEFAPDWAPDQAHLAISSREGAGAPVRISILDLATRTIQPVTDPPAGFVDTEPGYSPDGTQIVFARGNVSTYHLALFVVNIDGTGLRQLTPWHLDADYPSWSPDGSSIVFQNGANCCEDPLSEIYTINPDGTDLTLLSSPLKGSSRAFSGSGPLPDAQGQPQQSASIWPSWSPDGTRILFVRRTVASSSPLALFTMNADGTDVTPIQVSLPGEDYRDPAWGTHS